MPTRTYESRWKAGVPGRFRKAESVRVPGFSGSITLSLNIFSADLISRQAVKLQRRKEQILKSASTSDTNRERALWKSPTCSAWPAAALYVRWYACARTGAHPPLPNKTPNPVLRARHFRTGRLLRPLVERCAVRVRMGVRPGTTAPSAMPFRSRLRVTLFPSFTSTRWRHTRTDPPRVGATGSDALTASYTTSMSMRKGHLRRTKDTPRAATCSHTSSCASGAVLERSVRRQHHGSSDLRLATRSGNKSSRRVIHWAAFFATSITRSSGFGEDCASHDLLDPAGATPGVAACPVATRP